MTPSIRQQAVYDEWDNGNSNMLIQSVAGSGKTTVLLELLRKAEFRTLFLAFNKSIQIEINDHIMNNNLGQGKSMTLHALGLMAIKRAGKYKMHNGKNFEIVKKIQDSNPDIFKYMKWEEKVKIGYTLMDMNDVSRIYLTTNIEEIRQYMISMDKFFSNNQFIGELWNQFLELREEYYTGRVIKIDFIDMIYIPIVKELYIPIRPTYLFIDECQDLNMAQHKLIDMLIAQGDVERWVAVGDRNQAIYGFSGAYASSFDLFKEKEHVIELPLDICYRCPVDVVKSANEVYDIMQGFKTEPGIVAAIDNPIHVKDNSMIICRNSAPLIELYFHLLGMNRKVFIKGDDILGKVKAFLKPYTVRTIGYVHNKLYTDTERLKNATNDSQRFEYYKASDNLDNLTALVKGGLVTYEDTVKTLLEKLDEVFNSQEESGIVLCTIHKSKGLEANVVYILNENLIPSKFARSEQQLKQEQNLKYVARTRAKEELYYLDI